MTEQMEGMRIRWQVIDPNDLKWMDSAQCKGSNPALWHPDPDGGSYTLQVAAAVAACQGCPVIKDCLEFAIKYQQNTGVWGGKSERERKSIRRARQKMERVEKKRKRA